MTIAAAPQAVIFDVEGTLVDCVALQLESWRETLASAGHSFTHADLQPFSGMDGTSMLEQLLPAESPDTRQQLLKAQGETYRKDFLPRAKSFPGVRELFESLKQAGTLVGIATTCQKDDLRAYDGVLRILALTDATACGEMVKQGKPNPALFEVCLAALRITDAGGAIAVGDTPYDAMAAGQIGLPTVGVLTGGFSEAALKEAGCAQILRSVQDIRGLWKSASTARLRTAS
jgi:phosphoglycolate phosphatase-like HAD superfamily hydrolase